MQALLEEAGICRDVVLERSVAGRKALEDVLNRDANKYSSYAELVACLEAGSGMTIPSLLWLEGCLMRLHGVGSAQESWMQAYVALLEKLLLLGHGRRAAELSDFVADALPVNMRAVRSTCRKTQPTMYFLRKRAECCAEAMLMQYEGRLPRSTAALLDFLLTNWSPSELIAYCEDPANGLQSTAQHARSARSVPVAPPPSARHGVVSDGAWWEASLAVYRLCRSTLGDMQMFLSVRAFLQRHWSPVADWRWTFAVTSALSVVASDGATRAIKLAAVIDPRPAVGDIPREGYGDTPSPSPRSPPPSSRYARSPPGAASPFKIPAPRTPQRPTSAAAGKIAVRPSTTAPLPSSDNMIAVQRSTVRLPRVSSFISTAPFLPTDPPPSPIATTGASPARTRAAPPSTPPGRSYGSSVPSSSLPSSTAPSPARPSAVSKARSVSTPHSPPARPGVGAATGVPSPVLPRTANAYTSQRDEMFRSQSPEADRRDNAYTRPPARENGPSMRSHSVGRPGGSPPRTAPEDVEAEADVSVLKGSLRSQQARNAKMARFLETSAQNVSDARKRLQEADLQRLGSPPHAGSAISASEAARVTNEMRSLRERVARKEAAAAELQAEMDGLRARAENAESDLRRLREHVPATGRQHERTLVYLRSQLDADGIPRDGSDAVALLLAAHETLVADYSALEMRRANESMDRRAREEEDNARKIVLLTQEHQDLLAAYAKLEEDNAALANANAARERDFAAVVRDFTTLLDESEALRAALARAQGELARAMGSHRDPSPAPASPPRPHVTVPVSPPARSSSSGTPPLAPAPAEPADARAAAPDERPAYIIFNNKIAGGPPPAPAPPGTPPVKQKRTVIPVIHAQHKGSPLPRRARKQAAAKPPREDGASSGSASSVSSSTSSDTKRQRRHERARKKALEQQGAGVDEDAGPSAVRELTFPDSASNSRRSLEESVHQDTPQVEFAGFPPVVAGQVSAVSEFGNGIAVRVQSPGPPAGVKPLDLSALASSPAVVRSVSPGRKLTPPSKRTPVRHAEGSDGRSRPIEDFIRADRERSKSVDPPWMVAERALEMAAHARGASVEPVIPVESNGAIQSPAVAQLNTATEETCAAVEPPQQGSTDVGMSPQSPVPTVQVPTIPKPMEPALLRSLSEDIVATKSKVPVPGGHLDALAMSDTSAENLRREMSFGSLSRQSSVSVDGGAPAGRRGMSPAAIHSAWGAVEDTQNEWELKSLNSSLNSSLRLDVPVDETSRHDTSITSVPS